MKKSRNRTRGVFSDAEARASTLEYFEGNELATDVFLEKYALRNREQQLLEKSPTDMHWRIAREFARIEAKKFNTPLTAKEIFRYLDRFQRIIPQGSPMYGIGNQYQYISLSNCFVLPSPLDSIGGIHLTDQQLVQVCKRRGGVGWDLSSLRPNNSPVSNAARSSTGAVSFADQFSDSIRRVAQSGRRGASMQTMSVHHPDILEFVRAKLDKKRITGSNISVRLSDEFLSAVKNNTDYELRWPVDAEKPSISLKFSARKVWQEIIEKAHAMAEPGLLFWDTILRESVADCYASLGFRSVSTNPCSELVMCGFDSCRLLLLNLYAYVLKAFTSEAYFDYDAFYYDAGIAQRLQDDMVDLELEAINRIIKKIKIDPEPTEVKRVELDLWHNIRRTCQQGRRTGTGITGLGDALAALGLKYDSDASIEVVDKIYRTLKHGCYRSSVDMAKEIGAFPIWNHEMEKNSPFLLRIKDEAPDLWADMKKYGRRNIALLTTAPAGSVSIEAQTTSGIEPEFKLIYTRFRKIVPSDKNARVDRIDANGDSWMSYQVEADRPAIREWKKVTGKTDLKESPWWGSCAMDLDWQQRVKLQATATKHLEHSISSTINLPSDVSVAKVAEIYETAWALGCKGITVYRDGCRDGVLVDTNTSVATTADNCPECQEATNRLRNVIGQHGRPAEIVHTKAPKRPIVVPCNIHRARVEGNDWLFFVGVYRGAIYEIWGGHAKRFEIPRKYNTGWIVRNGKVDGRTGYDLYLGDLEDEEERLIFRNIGKLLDKYDKGPFTRLASLALRHGAPIRFMCETIVKDDESDLHSFARVMARVLKTYIQDGEKAGGECPKCGGRDVTYRNGCPECQICHWTYCS